MQSLFVSSGAIFGPAQADIVRTEVQHIPEEYISDVIQYYKIVVKERENTEERIYDSETD